MQAATRKFNINENLVCAVGDLYGKAISAVQMNGSMGERFRRTDEVWKGCLFSPTLFNSFLERIVADVLEGHGGNFS